MLENDATRTFAESIDAANARISESLRDRKVEEIESLLADVRKGIAKLAAENDRLRRELAAERQTSNALRIDREEFKRRLDRARARLASLQ